MTPFGWSLGFSAVFSALATGMGRGRVFKNVSAASHTSSNFAAYTRSGTGAAGAAASSAAPTAGHAKPPAQIAASTHTSIVIRTMGLLPEPECSRKTAESALRAHSPQLAQGVSMKAYHSRSGFQVSRNLWAEICGRGWLWGALTAEGAVA